MSNAAAPHQQHGFCVALAQLFGCGCRQQRPRNQRVDQPRGAPRPSAPSRYHTTAHSPVSHVSRSSSPGDASPTTPATGVCIATRTDERCNETTALIPKSRGLDASFASSPELPKPTLPKGFRFIEDYDLNAEVCPTCLESYTTDNPKILTFCKHNFHLSCIYEWLERSDLCPVCSKTMRDAKGQKFLES